MDLPKWMNRDVLLISFSAFFADLGYQAVQAIFPIYLVITLASSPIAFGIANALAFGGGALFAYAGGVLSDKYSRKWISVAGSVFILLLSAIGLTINPVLAVVLFAGGWWGRNFRSPPRRAMLADAVRKEHLGNAFGFLHALDIGGGMIAVIILIILLAGKVGQNSIILITAIPLAISVFLLLITRDIKESKYHRMQTHSASETASKINKRTFSGIIFATALYGFSYYSLGFPILTIAKSASSDILGIGSYGVYLGISAITGYYVGSMKRINKIKALGYFGYILSGVGTAVLAISYGLNYGTLAMYLGVALMGFGLGVVETMEPTIISLLRKDVKIGKSMGSLQGSRSLGIFFANLVMGILYVVDPFYSYLYAAIVAIAAGVVVLFYGKDFR